MSTDNGRNGTRRRAHQVVALGDCGGGSAAATVRRDCRRHGARLLLRRSPRKPAKLEEEKKEGRGEEKESPTSTSCLRSCSRRSRRSPIPAGQARPLGGDQPEDAGQLSRLRRRLADLAHRRTARKCRTRSPTRRSCCEQPARAADQGPPKSDREHALRSARPTSR